MCKLIQDAVIKWYNQPNFNNFNNMNKVLIIGVSSGIGRALVKKLIKEKSVVWGVARRENLLSELSQELNNKPAFIYQSLDISKKNSWKNILLNMKKKKFKPNIVVFNAAINQNDLELDINPEMTKKIFQVNFFSILEGIKVLIPYMNQHSQYIAVSSSSALKGNAKEGIGYPSSKSAISIAFESLYQKYYLSGKMFTTVSFGPINTGMKRFKTAPPFTLSEENAVNCIIKAINGKKGFYYCPQISFIFLKVVKAILPNEIALKLFSIIEKKYNN